MSKFQRTYTLTVQGRSMRLYDFSDPLTIIFDTTSRLMSGINSAHFMVYNLGPVVRSDLEFDSAVDINALGVVKRAVSFSAGYASEGYQPVVFQGNIKKAFSYRDGPNVVTDIEVLDGLDAIQKAQIQRSRSSPWDPNAEALAIIQTMAQYGVTLGAIGGLFKDAKNTRGVMWLGSVWDVLKKFAAAQGGVACINQEKLYLMGPRDALVIFGEIPQLDSSTGLIGTPRRSGWVVDAEMIFEPRVQLGQKLKVASSVNPNINGTFRVDAISHRGIISGAKDGGVVTSFSLYNSPNGFDPVVVI